MKKVDLLTKSMGTICKITLYAQDNQQEGAKNCVNNIRKYLFDLDDRLSVFKKDSEISRLNREAYKKAVELSSDTFEIIKLSKQYYFETKGLFDITVGKQTYAWQQNQVCSKARVKIKRIKTDKLILNEQDRTVSFGSPDISIDLGGIAKGYAADRIRDMIRSAGMEKAIINLGGTVSVISAQENIGIRNPFMPMNVSGRETLFAHLSCKNETVVTSGIYEQHKDKEMLSHHIINPSTGKPCKTDLLSATVISENGAMADAFATAFIVSGLRNAVKLSQETGISAIFIDRSGRVYVSESIKERFVFRKEISA